MNDHFFVTAISAASQQDDVRSNFPDFLNFRSGEFVRIAADNFGPGP